MEAAADRLRFDRTFKWALGHVEIFEGGFSDDPDDKGGATKYGITKATLSAWRGQPVTTNAVRQLTRAEAEEIYFVRYWEALRCDVMAPGIAFAVFDGAINQGGGFAPKALQRAAGVTADGIIGRRTLGAVKKGGRWVLLDFCARRGMRYALTGAHRVLSRKYWRGWFTRLLEVYRIAAEKGC